MTKSSKKKGRTLYSKITLSLGTVAFFFSLFSFANFAYADTIIYSQPTGGTFHSNGGFTPFVPTANGIIRHIRFWPQSGVGYDGKYIGLVMACYNGTCSSHMTGLSINQVFSSLTPHVDGEPVDMYFTTSESAIEVTNFSGLSTATYPGIDIRYANTPIEDIDDFGNGSSLLNLEDDNTTTSWSGNGSKYDNRLLIDGELPIPDDTTPRIINTYPANGTTTASTTVEFGADLYNDSATEVCWYLQNYDLGQTIVPICSDVIASGETSTATTTTLAAGYYSGYAEMVGTQNTTGSNVRKNIYFIVVASYYAGLSTPNGNIFLGQGYSTTTDMQTWCDNIDNDIVRTLCMIPQRTVALAISAIIGPDSLQKFVENRQDLEEFIQGRIPFALYFDLKDKVNSLEVPTSTPSAVVAVNMPWATSTTMFDFDEVKETMTEFGFSQEENIETILNLAILIMTIVGIIATFKILF